jgi:hypothetical protein
MDISQTEMYPITDMEKSFDIALASIALNPANENLAKLKAIIVPQKIRASFIVERLQRSGLPEEPSPAITAIAQECPYAFFIANDQKPIEITTALKHLALGFLSAYVQVNTDAGKRVEVPIAICPIRYVETSQLPDAKNAATTKDRGFKLMQKLLDLDLNPFYEYKFNDGPSRDLYRLVYDSQLTKENQKKFTSMIDATVKSSSVQSMADINSMFKRSSPFNWTEKGKPFVLAKQINNANNTTTTTTNTKVTSATGTTVWVEHRDATGAITWEERCKCGGTCHQLYWRWDGDTYKGLNND